MAQTFSLKVELNFTVIGCECETWIGLLGWSHSQVNLDALLLTWHCTSLFLKLIYKF